MTSVVGTLVDRFLPIVQSLPEDFEIAGEIEDALTLDKENAIRVVWAPFEYVPLRPVLALVGITPGRYQAERGLRTFREALRNRLPLEDALRSVKAASSFSGPMRANLTAMLDHIGLHHALRIDSSAALFGPAAGLAHFTSALRYPVFANGSNYSGKPDMFKTPILRRWIEATLVQDLRRFPEILWVPLGLKPTAALSQLAAIGLLDADRILDGVPHPSGANAGHIALFLGRKPQHDPTVDRLRSRVARMLSFR